MITEKIKGRLQELRAAGAKWLERIEQNEQEAMRLYIEQARDEAILKELERLLAEIDEQHGPLEPTAQELLPVRCNTQAIAADPDYQKANSGRDSEVIEQLEAGINMAEIARNLGMNYSRVYSIRNRWERSKKRDDQEPAAEESEEDTAAAQPEEDQTATANGSEGIDGDEPTEADVIAPLLAGTRPVRGGANGTDDYHKPITPTELEMMKNRVEQFVKAAKRVSYTQILQACNLSAGQFGAVLKVAAIIKNEEGLYVPKRIF